MPEQITGRAVKVFRTGTHRTRLPEETWEIVRPRLREFGITRVADVTGLDVIGIPVCMAVRPLARTLSVSQGKGHSALLAKISAVMEAIELWHAEYGCPPAAVSATPASTMDLPYALDQLDLFSGALIGERTPLDWLTGTGMCSGRPVPVPRPMVRMTRNLTEGWSPLGFRTGSSGLASGNDLAEASLHALYELLERNSLKNLNESPDGRIPIDPRTVEEPTCAELIDRIRAAGAKFELVLVPNQWDLPCFVAYVWSHDFPVFAVGSGAHSSAGVAMSRAITEAVQSRLTAITGSRDDLAPMYAHVRRGLGVEPAGPPELIPYAEVMAGGPEEFDDVAEEVAWISRLIERHTGVEPIVTDLSTAADFAVAKVLAPGLHFADRHVVPRPRY